MCGGRGIGGPGCRPGRTRWSRRDGAAMVAAWNDELRALGYVDPPGPASIVSSRPGALDRDGAVEVVLSRLGAKRSAWNAADIRGQVERWIAETGLVADARGPDRSWPRTSPPGPRRAAAGSWTADVPEHVRALTSPRVIAVEDRITRLAAARSPVNGDGGPRREARALSLDPPPPRAAAGGRAGRVKQPTGGRGRRRCGEDHHPRRHEGPARGGSGRRMLVVTPTLKAAEVAAGGDRRTGRSRRRGWSTSGDGGGTTTATGPAPPRTSHPRATICVVVTCWWSTRPGCSTRTPPAPSSRSPTNADARVAFVGDRHQLPAVGRGGVLDLAAQHAGHEATVSLEVVHRFADPELRPDQPRDAPRRAHRRPGGTVFDALWRRGQIRIHPSDAERTHALAQLSGRGDPRRPHQPRPDGRHPRPGRRAQRRHPRPARRRRPRRRPPRGRQRVR